MPPYVPLLVIAVSLFVVGSLSILGTFGLARSTLSDHDRTRAGLVAIIAFPAWIALVLTLGYTNILVPTQDQAIPVLGLAILGSTLGWSVLILGTSSGRHITGSIPVDWLVAVQIFRVIGLIFLLLESERLLSSYFAISTGWGDIAVGVAAPFVAYWAWRRASGWGVAVMVWSLAGIADLLLVIYKALRTAPGPLQIPTIDIPTVIVAYFPFSLIPLMIVPAALVLHVVTIYRVFTHDKAGEASGATPALG